MDYQNYGVIVAPIESRAGLVKYGDRLAPIFQKEDMSVLFAVPNDIFDEVIKVKGVTVVRVPVKTENLV